MKIVLTGSLGRINRPLAEELIQSGHEVTIISSNPQRENDIEALGAKASIGQLEDTDFLAATFTGADAVYCMTPPPNLFDQNIDPVAFYLRFGPGYLNAIRQSRVRRVVHLSSVGAHTDKDNGMLRYAYEIEQFLKQLPPEVAIISMRPVGFYYNLLGFIPAIKGQGMITSNYGGDDQKPWVSPIDIAAAVAQELTTGQPGERKMRYIASDELSCNEVARILGTAIGKPDLKWQVIPDEQMLDSLKRAGMNPNTARGFIEMNAGMHSGELYEDYYRDRPSLGKVKMVDFAAEFAKVYYQE